MNSNKKEPQGDEALTKEIFFKIIFWLWINLEALISMWATKLDFGFYLFGTIFLFSALMLSRRLSTEVFRSRKSC